MERRPRVTFLVVRLGGYPPTLLRGARRKRLCPHQIPSIPRSIRTRAISLLTVRTCRTHTTTRGAARRAVYVVGRREPRVTSRALARVTRGKDVTRVCLTRPRPGSCVVTPRPAFSFLSMVQTRLVGVRWTIDGEGGVLARTLIDEAPEERLIAKGVRGATRRLCDSSSRLASDRGARRPCTSASAACAAALRYSRVEV